MTNEKKLELFERMPIPKAVASLAIPTIAGSLVMVLYNLADTYFVGALNAPVESAAVTLAAPVLLAFNAVINLFGVGTGSYMSRALGSYDYGTVRRTSAFGFWCALIMACLFSLCCIVGQTPLLALLGADAQTAGATADYLFWTVKLGAVPAIMNVIMGHLIRSEGESARAGIGTISGCVLNIIIDPFFIMPWGLGWGAAGAGCATFISNCAACIYFLVFLYTKRGKTYVSIGLRHFTFEKTIAMGVLTVGIPAMVQNLLNVTGMTVLNNFTSVYGTDAVAAMGITHKVNMIPLYFSMGLGQGIMPLVGYCYAKGDSRRMKECIAFTAKLAVGFILAATAVYYWFAGPIITMFMKNETIVAYGTRFLRGFCLGLPFLCVDFLAVGIFQAVGMGKESFVFAVMRKIALEIPAIYILNAIWPLYGMAYSQLCAELVLAIAAGFVLAGLFRRVAEREAEEQKKKASKDAL